MDNNALPKIMGDWDSFQQQVKTATAGFEENANRQRQRQEANEAKRYAAAAATATTVVCTATAPSAYRGARTTFLFNLPKQRLIGREGDGDFIDRYMGISHERDLPLTISDNTISWKGDANLVATLNRTTLVLDWENDTFRFKFECRVMEKQL